MPWKMNTWRRFSEQAFDTEQLENLCSCVPARVGKRQGWICSYIVFMYTHTHIYRYIIYCTLKIKQAACGQTGLW